jgi:hypothetical protein
VWRINEMDKWAMHRISEDPVVVVDTARTPLGCYWSLETAQRTAEEWSGSPLDWRWMRLSPEFGFSWNQPSWYASDYGHAAQ